MKYTRILFISLLFPITLHAQDPPHVEVTRLWTTGPDSIVELENEGFEAGLGNFTNSGIVNWSTTGSEFLQGSQSATSNLVVGGQTATLELSLIVPSGYTATLEFFTLADTTQGSDMVDDVRFAFKVDGTVFNDGMLEPGWTMRKYFIADGNHTLTWQAYHDQPGSDDMLQVYLDSVVIRYHQQPALRMADGSEGFGKVMVSDAHGNATWGNLSDITSFENPQGNFLLPLVLDGKHLVEVPLSILGGERAGLVSMHNDTGVVAEDNSRDGFASSGNMRDGFVARYNSRYGFYARDNGTMGFRSQGHEYGFYSRDNTTDGFRAYNNTFNGYSSESNKNGFTASTNTENGFRAFSNGHHGFYAAGNTVNGFYASGNTVNGFYANDNNVNGFRSDSSGASGFLAFGSVENGFAAHGNIDDGFYASGNIDDGFHADDNYGKGFAARYNDEDGFYAYSNSGDGFDAWSNGGDGIYSIGNTGYDGYFSGNVYVDNLSKGGGSFKIDHPLDPENKFLYHSFVESPDMMNVYNGNVVLDVNGEAIVQLADWFEPLNRDFRYQLTAIGAPGPNLYIAEEMHNNQFRIAGGAPGIKVSWQVTGIRQDPYANDNRIQVEAEKPAKFKGYYLHPEAYGRGFEEGFDYVKLGYKTLEQLQAEAKEK